MHASQSHVRHIRLMGLYLFHDNSMLHTILSIAINNIQLLIKVELFQMDGPNVKRGSCLLFS